MASQIKWKMKGLWLKNCSCDPGCPCDFWANPTKHFCEGMIGMKIDEGFYGDVPLGGLNFAAQYHWPGPLHEGNGTLQPIVDERASPEQRNAILTIMSGQAGNAWFELLPMLISTVHDPLFLPIHCEIDVKGRRARFRVPGLLETESEPIKNIATGGAHSIQVVLPEGMEYKVAETAVATVNRGTGKLQYDHVNCHSSLARVEQTESGLIG